MPKIVDGTSIKGIKMSDQQEDPRMAPPMTREEWVEMMSMTLHGPLPQKTLYRIYTTVDHLFAKVSELENKLERTGK